MDNMELMLIRTTHAYIRRSIVNAYTALENIIIEIDDLVARHVLSSAPAFQAWKTKVERFLIKHYGQDSYEHKRFLEERFSLPFYTFDTPDSHFIAACKSGLLSTKAIFKTYLDELKEENQGISSPETADVNDCSPVFIVHGHNGELKQSLARIIEKQGIEAIILHEQTNPGATIIEKFEEHSNVGAAICLFTADDQGKAKADTELNPRARQNVVFEAGFFIGKLGRKKVIILADKGVEFPSDMHGIVYTDSTNWEAEVLKGLAQIGYSIDYNKHFGIANK